MLLLLVVLLVRYHKLFLGNVFFLGWSSGSLFPSSSSSSLTNHSSHDKNDIKNEFMTLLKEPSMIACLELTQLSLKGNVGISPEYVTKILTVCTAITTLDLEGFRGELPRIHGPAIVQLHLKENSLSDNFSIHCPLITGNCYQ